MAGTIKLPRTAGTAREGRGGARRGSAGRGGVGLYGYGEPNNAHSACKSIELFKAQADVEIAGEKANEIPIGRRPGNAEKGKDHSDSTGTQ